MPSRSSSCRLLVALLGVAGLLGCESSPDHAPVPARDPSAGPGPFVVLIGAPAAGKSTVGEWLAKGHGIPLVNMGDVLEREAARASTLRLSSSLGHGKLIHRRRQAQKDRARRVEAALEKLEAGELVTDQEFNAVVASRLLESDCRNGFILDGFPASADQAEFLDTLLDPKTADLLTVIYLDVPDDVAIARMEERARADDKRGFGEERLRQFRANIASVLDYYKEDGLFTVDATQNLETVEREIDGIIAKRQAASEQAGSEPAEEPSSSGK